MRDFQWDPAKSQWLRAHRGVGFEEMVFEIANGNLLDVLEHPRPERYGGQRLFVIRHEDYAYLVPFVESPESLFLKTVIPSRRATKRYLDKENEGEIHAT